MSVGTKSTKLGESEQEARIGDEEGTNNKLAFCALQNGSFDILDLSYKRPAFSSLPSQSGGALTAITYSASTHLFATGSSTGLLSVYDIRVLPSPGSSSASRSGSLFTCRRNEAQLESLSFLPPTTSSNSDEVHLAIAPADGLPYTLSVRPEGPIISEELVGYDCDPVRCVRVVEGLSGEKRARVWTGGDDGVVRMY